MTLNAQAIEEFGQSLGIEGMSLSTPGFVQLEFEQRGILWCESFEDALIVSLVRDLTPSDETDVVLRKALEACHYREGLPFPVQPGMRGESSLAFVVRLDPFEVTLPVLGRVLDLLSDLHERVRG